MAVGTSSLRLSLASCSWSHQQLHQVLSRGSGTSTLRFSHVAFSSDSEPSQLVPWQLVLWHSGFRILSCLRLAHADPVGMCLESVTISPSAYLACDNMAALALLCKMQPKSASLNIIAREIAPTTSFVSYMPDFIQHVTGVSNNVADALSSRFEVGDFVLPSSLENAFECTLQERDAQWWLTRRVGTD